MDPIHPIVPTQAQLPPVEPLRRVARTTREPAPHERPRRDGRRPAARPPRPAKPGDDEHLDVRV